MAIVRRLIVMLALCFGLAACADVRGQLATPEQMRSDRTLVQTQLDEVGSIRCPARTELRIIAGGGGQIRYGYNGRISGGVQYECVPPGTPHTARPAAQPFAGEFQRPYTGGSAYEYHYGVGNTFPRGYWEGGYRRHPSPGYAPNGHRPYWDGVEWVCRNFYGQGFRCLMQ